MNRLALLEMIYVPGPRGSSVVTRLVAFAALGQAGNVTPQGEAIQLWVVTRVRAYKVLE